MHADNHNREKIVETWNYLASSQMMMVLRISFNFLNFIASYLD